MKTLLSLVTLATLLAFQTGCQSPSPADQPITRASTATPDFQGECFDLKDLDQQPKAIKRVPPVYPFELKRKGIGGYALIEFIIDPSGRPGHFKAVRASHEAFISATIHSLSQWRFKPGLKDGKPCACRMQQPMEFSINEY